MGAALLRCGIQVVLYQSMFLTVAIPISTIGAIDNRTAILECSLPNFRLVGRCLEVQEIVETVGVIKPTLYYYFTNKPGLLEILLEEKFSP
jgi:hypothetical protein